MHLHWLIFFLVSMGWVSDAQYCSATQNAEAREKLFSSMKDIPLIFNSGSAVHPVNIEVILHVNAIINVIWQNLNLGWNKTDFCGIETFSAPKTTFWIPDIGIVESIKTEFGTKESPNVLLLSDGTTILSDSFALTTACKMDLYRFPFDTQICSITFQSTTLTKKEITINPNSSKITNVTDQNNEVQGEWDLYELTYTEATVNATAAMWIEMDQLKYQIIIKRKPRLYVMNIIVPVLFFLLLDVISFFIDTKGGEKMSFKVTLLLSISVMLLLVNNTLPSTANEIPLIGVYCSGIFYLIAISILETIFVTYLTIKRPQKTSAETTATVSERDDSVRVQQNPPDSVRDQNEEKSCTLNCMKQILTECWPATRQNLREKIFLSWPGIINKIFLVLYIISIIVFLSMLWKIWIP